MIATASAAVNEPAKTESSANVRRSSSPSRPTDQATAAPNDPCRLEVREPEERSRNRRSSPAATSATSSVCSRAAASSMARGNPSRRRTISVMRADPRPSGRTPARRRCSLHEEQDGRVVLRRRPNGGTGQSTSPLTRRRSRLVVTIVTFGQPPPPPRPAPPSVRGRARSCRAAGPPRGRRARPARRSLSPTPGRPSMASAAATASTAESVVAVASSMSTTGRSAARRAGGGRPRSASRDLPTPPGPTSVTTRWSPTREIASPTRSSRPSRDVAATGRRWGGVQAATDEPRAARRAGR